MVKTRNLGCVVCVVCCGQDENFRMCVPEWGMADVRRNPESWTDTSDGQMRAGLQYGIDADTDTDADADADAADAKRVR